MASRRGAGVPLSRREWEIAALVEEGLSDREIAERLFLSRRTVEGHLQQVRNKLGFSNRAQISSWVASQKREPVPVARSAARPPDNLPPQFTTFIGRERDLGGVRQLLRRARVVTITGAGGSGKTRLALQVASEVLLQYPAGVWFFALDSMSDPDAVPRQVAAVVGRLRSSQPVLLLLDNCEHLAASCAATVDALLRSRSHLAFLCTSREPLHLSGEAIWKAGSLSLPPARRHETPDSLVRLEAVRLFLDRACLHDAELTLDGTNAADIANLCRQLDGMPLALELAAARVGLMPLCQIVDMSTRCTDPCCATTEHRCWRVSDAWTSRSPTTRRSSRPTRTMRSTTSTAATCCAGWAVSRTRSRTTSGPSACRHRSRRSTTTGATCAPRWGTSPVRRPTSAT
jgi:DNA-binding CsgD family transcriptional regulator